MIRINKGGFLTREDAEVWREQYYTNWHPAGYGTSIDIVQADDGTYICKGSRGSSCD